MSSRSSTPSSNNILKQVQHLIRRHSEVIVILFTLLMVIISASASPLFLSIDNISNILRQATALGIISLGHMLVMLVGGIDLSVGTVAAASSVIAAVVMDGQNNNVLVAVCASLSIGGIVGLINGLVITKLKLPDFVVTLGVWSVANGLLFVYSKGAVLGKAAPLLQDISKINVASLPLTMLIWLALSIVLFIFLSFTRWGRHVYAVGGNSTGARNSGINADLIKISAYVLCGLLASCSGLILLSRVGVGYSLIGQDLQMDSIASAVIGGTSLLGGVGSVGGTFFGVLIISGLNNILNLLKISSFTQIMLKGIVIIVVVILRVVSEKKR